MLSAMNKMAVCALVPFVLLNTAYAAGLERSPQSIEALFEAGTYAEIGYTFISPDITGHDLPVGAQTSSTQLPNLAKDFQALNYAVKLDLSPKFRLAVIYDEPYGADVEFSEKNNFVAENREGKDKYTRAKVKTKNITTLLGYKLNNSVMAYAGPALQEVKEETHLRGVAYGGGNGYDNKMADDLAVGWVAGLRYTKPELGIAASLTYRSEIDHKTTAHENVPLADKIGLDYEHVNPTKVTTPESYNLNLQTGLNQTTVLFAKLRYVPWSNFEYRPAVLNQATQIALGKERGLPLVDYSKDQTAVELGVGKKVLPNLTVSTSVLWDSGAGNPVTVLGPIDGYWGVGLGTKYNFTPKVAMSFGGRYLWFGDAQGKVSDGRVVGKFEDNTGYMLGVKLSYQSK
ncbi:MAG: outer membrane protein transport protein [Acinetobacter sp.]